jgi:hypothetical protein
MVRGATRSGVQTLRTVPKKGVVAATDEELSSLGLLYCVGCTIAFPTFVYGIAANLKCSKPKTFAGVLFQFSGRVAVASVPAAACTVVWPAFVALSVCDLAIEHLGLTCSDPNDTDNDVYEGRGY